MRECVIEPVGSAIEADKGTGCWRRLRVSVPDSGSGRHYRLGLGAKGTAQDHGQ